MPPAPVTELDPGDPRRSGDARCVGDPTPPMPTDPTDVAARWLSPPASCDTDENRELAVLACPGCGATIVSHDTAVELTG